MTKSFPAFDVALKRGQERERAFEAMFGDDDLVLIECKSQVDSRTHVFIEYSGYGKPSGMATTQAKFWAIEVVKDRWVMLRTEDLHEMAIEAYRRFGESVGGDQNASRGVSIPKRWLVEADRR